MSKSIKPFTFGPLPDASETLLFAFVSLPDASETLLDARVRPFPTFRTFSDPSGAFRSLITHP
jgi:hypothetical protein